MSGARVASWWLALLVSAGAAACSGDDFTGEPAPGGGSSGTDAGESGGAGTGATGNGGASGSGGSGGSGGGAGGAAGESGAAGSAAGGAGGTGCDQTGCRQGEYCRADGVCRMCSDWSELHFGAPEPLATINAAFPTRDLRAPRDVIPPAMVFVAGANPAARELRYTRNYLSDAGGAIPAPVDGADEGESDGLFIAPPGNGLLAGLNLLFDRDTPWVPRKLYGAVVPENDPPVVSELPAPFNSAGSNYSIAYAHEAGRAWWYSNRDFRSRILTAPTTDSGTPSATALNLTLHPGNCEVNEADLAPWVTPDGKLLLFQARERDGCSLGTSWDLFAVSLGTDGLPAGAASRLDASIGGFSDITPALSRDGCWLLFASNRKTAGARTQLYRAPRN
jgi:hypothetical protein